MFILDTDHLIIAQRDSQPEADRLRRQMKQHRESDFHLTIITIHEQLLGAQKNISQSRALDSVVRGYRLIESAMIYYNDFQVLPFDEPASLQFQRLRTQGIRIGTMDLRIASIALSHNYTVLTRNTIDFGRVPDLRIEDWTTETF